MAMSVADILRMGKDSGGGDGGEAQNKNKKKTNKKRKSTVPRVWIPEEYTLVRNGVVLNEQPDLILDMLSERALFLFKHNNPTVEFGGDPSVPLWKGVFKLAPRFNYRDNEYFNPTQRHLKLIYQSRPQKDRPAKAIECSRPDGSTYMREEPTNDIIQRTGKVYPYWVDDWYHMKKRQKRAKRRHGINNGSADGATERLLAGAKMRSSKMIRESAVAESEGGVLQEAQRDAAVVVVSTVGRTVVPTDGVFIFPLTGRMAENARKRPGAQKAIIPSTILKVSPADALAKQYKRHLSELGTHAFDPVGPGAPRQPPQAGDDDDHIPLPYEEEEEAEDCQPAGAPGLTGSTAPRVWEGDRGSDPFDEARHLQLRRKRPPPSQEQQRDVDDKMRKIAELATMRKQRANPHLIQTPSTRRALRLWESPGPEGSSSESPSGTPPPDRPAGTFIPPDPPVPRAPPKGLSPSALRVERERQPPPEADHLRMYTEDQHARCISGSLIGVSPAYYRFYSSNGEQSANPSAFYVLDDAGKEILRFHTFVNRN